MEDTTWLKKKKLFFVFTSAGKPVWTRFGEESDMTTFIGSLAAILYKFQHYYTGVSDSLRYLRTKDMCAVFLCTEALYYVCISKGDEALDSLYHQLEMLHTKVISTLTNNITDTLIRRPNYDARSLMGGTHSSLDTLMKTCGKSPSFLEGYMPVRMPGTLRSNIHSAFKSNSHEDLLYGFLLTPTYILYKYCRKGEKLHPVDALLLMNLLASYSSLRSSMSWTPVCLPNYSKEGFLYAYITFMQNTSMSIVLVSDNAGSFKKMKTRGDSMEKELGKISDKLEESILSMPYSVSITEIKELKHFMYMPRGTGQYTMSGFSPSTSQASPEMSSRNYKRLLKRYHHSYRLSKFQEYSRGNFMRLDTYRNEKVLCLRQSEYTLMASFSPMVPTDSVVQSLTSLLKWLKVEEANLFILK